MLIALVHEGCARSGTPSESTGVSPVSTPNDNVARPLTMKGVPTPEVKVSQALSHKLSIPMPVSTNALENKNIQYSIRYPVDWHVGGKLVATGFANSSQCESVEVVDFRPPPGSGASFILHSFVQICAKRLLDRLTLDDFMRRTYGDSTRRFQVTELGGIKAYRAMDT
jgi:hypothetical protein